MSTALTSQLRRKVRTLKEDVARLKAQNAQELLDLAAQHPVISDTAVITSLKALLKSLGEEIKPHDTLHHKISNIITAKNSYRERYNEVMKMPATEMLKRAIGVIMAYRRNEVGQHQQANGFLAHPIIKALLKEMGKETG